MPHNSQFLRAKIAKFSGEEAYPLPRPYLRWGGDNLSHILPFVTFGHSPLPPPGKNPMGIHGVEWIELQEQWSVD